MHVIMNLIHFGSQISGHDMQIAYYMMLATPIQVESPYWMM